MDFVGRVSRRRNPPFCRRGNERGGLRRAKCASRSRKANPPYALRWLKCYTPQPSRHTTGRFLFCADVNCFTLIFRTGPKISGAQ